MKYIVSFGVTIVAALVLSGLMASTSMAAVECVRVAETGSGNWNNNACTGTPVTPAEYIRIEVPPLPVPEGHNVFCAKAAETNGNFTNASCTARTATRNGEYVRIYGPGVVAQKQFKGPVKVVASGEFVDEGS